MSLSKKHIEEFKRIFKEEYDKEMTDEEAEQAGNSLVDLFEIFWEMSVEDQKRQRRLKAEPKGFPVESHHTCIVCYRSIDPETGWFDQNKQKCLSCQKAVEEGILPSFVCHNRSSFFLNWELASKFKIKTQTARKYVRNGQLKARITSDGEYIFLKKENPSLIERYTAIRKSYDRNRAKVGERWSKRMKEEILAEKKKLR